jgi:2-dehydropantoate 2-reductase
MINTARPARDKGYHAAGVFRMTERRRILIVGAGAIGGLYAAYLAKVAEVAVLDTNRTHVAAIRKDGLKLTGRTESATKLAAFASAAEMGKRRFDAAIILVKSQATEAAFESIRSGLEGRPVLVTFQNGMGNEDLLMGLTDLDVAHGVSFEAARYDGPGRVHHLVHGENSWLGPARGKVESIAWLGELMTLSGLPTKVVADPRGAIWGKFIFNSVMNPIGAIVQGVNAARYEVPEMRALIDDMAAECIRVAEALGIRLAFDPMYLVKKTRSGESPLTEHAGSMAQDLEAGRETELEAMTGYIVRKAKELGVPVPVTESVYRMAKGVEYAARAKREGA